MIFPVPQSFPQLTAPPTRPPFTAQPTLLQLPAGPAPPIKFNSEGSFGKMFENMMMPREFGFKSQQYAAEQVNDDVMDALPPHQ